MNADPQPGQGNNQAVIGPDSFSMKAGVILLGVITLFCIFALAVLARTPEQPGAQVPPAPETTQPQEGATAQGQVQTAQTSDGQPADQAQPISEANITANAATTSSTLGLLGQIVGILGTIAAAAVGGIAGLLTGRS